METGLNIVVCFLKIRNIDPNGSAESKILFVSISMHLRTTMYFPIYESIAITSFVSSIYTRQHLSLLKLFKIVPFVIKEDPL
jgi:hypothetical protein